jgi:hypothetical protein
MKKIRVYRNPDCARCARFAKVARFFDWFDRVEHSTEAPKTGPLRLGEVVVEDFSDGGIHRGADGIEMIWRQIPVYAPFRLLFKLPAFRRFVDQGVSGGGACAVNAQERKS